MEHFMNPVISIIRPFICGVRCVLKSSSLSFMTWKRLCSESCVCLGAVFRMLVFMSWMNSMATNLLIMESLWKNLGKYFYLGCFCTSYHSDDYVLLLTKCLFLLCCISLVHRCFHSVSDGCVDYAAVAMGTLFFNSSWSLEPVGFV